MEGTGAARGRLYTGPAGWSYRDWEGRVYPAGTGLDRLLHIARYFDCVELNSSFYRTPSHRMVESWSERLSHIPDFSMNIKVLQRFTHEREFSRAELDGFVRTFDPLWENGRLGAFLMQFPWSFRNIPENVSYIEDLASSFGDRPLCVEVRHGSWQTTGALSFFSDNGLCLCSIDQPLVGDSLKPSATVTTPEFGYIRLHGRNRDNWFRKDAGRDERYDYLYDENELNEWKSRAVEMLGKTRKLFIITNNHFRGQALVNALQLRSLIDERKIDVPPLLAESYPDLARYAARGSSGFELS